MKKILAMLACLALVGMPFAAVPANAREVVTRDPGEVADRAQRDMRRTLRLQDEQRARREGRSPDRVEGDTQIRTAPSTRRPAQVAPP